MTIEPKYTKEQMTVEEAIKKMWQKKARFL